MRYFWSFSISSLVCKVFVAVKGIKMSQRRRAAEVAEKKAADAIRSDDIIEDIIPESKSWSSEQSQSSNEKPSLAGAAAKAKLGAAKPKGKDTEVKQLEEMADQEEKGKTIKFDQSKKVCSKQ